LYLLAQAPAGGIMTAWKVHYPAAHDESRKKAAASVKSANAFDGRLRCKTNMIYSRSTTFFIAAFMFDVLLHHH
jgi:hypothetical protein